MPTNNRIVLYAAEGDPEKWASLAEAVGLTIKGGLRHGQPNPSALGRLIAANHDNQRLVDLLRALAQKGEGDE